jgi:Xaa-Pro aminopeptidase
VRISWPAAVINTSSSMRTPMPRNSFGTGWVIFGAFAFSSSSSFLAAQRKGIETVAPGATHEQVHHAAVRTLVEGMVELGLLSGSVDECIESESYKTYYMHGTGHWLGMDVHDVGSYREGEESRRLHPGVVMTVEPGLYVRKDATDAPAEYRGIGVRIEDDVVVTETGCDVLTAGVPKERKEIDALRARRAA